MTKKLKDDLDGEDDDKAQSALERDVARVRSAKTDDKPVSSDDGDDDIEVDTSDDDDDDDDEASARPSRAERRRDRGRNLVSEANLRAEAAERRAAEAERIARDVASRIQAAPKQEEKDPADDELEKAYADQKSMYREYEARKAARTLTEADINDFEKRGREIEQRKLTAVAKKLQASNRGPSPDEVVARVRQQQLAEEHSDIISNPQHFTWVRGRMQQELAEGKPDTKATVDAVMDLARRKFGLTPRGGRPAPSDAAKRRLGGMSRGGGSASEGGAKITMTKELRNLADAAYGHIKDDKERYRMWAKGPGRRLQEQGKL